MKYPIPINALDDRLGWVGTTGSGKTYNASAGVELLLTAGARVVVIDPLDVWWGLRLMPDGETPSEFAPVVFGGAHADLPLTEHAGALIGETVAGMAESAIVSLGGFTTKASERRFMLAFLETLYRKAGGEPVHLIFDEADLWAPQRTSEPALQAKMEQIVRRGRIKGLIPWLITQRPAVLSKDVLSQVDGLVSFKLTSSQDRDAIGAWVEGQADKDQWKTIRAEMPTLARGRGVVWMPARGILVTADFPEKRTFDSSRTPKRGETRRRAELPPIDLGALRERLEGIEAETKENDPARLKKRIRELEKELAGGDKKDTNAIRMQGYDAGFADGFDEASAATEGMIGALSTGVSAARDAVVKAEESFLKHWEDFQAHAAKAKASGYRARSSAGERRPCKPDGAGSNPAGSTNSERHVLTPLARDSDGAMPKAEREFLTALAQQRRPLARNQIAIFAGYSAKSRHVDNTLASLRAKGWIDGSRQAITITAEGFDALGEFQRLPTGAALQDYWIRKLDKAAGAFLSALCGVYPDSLSRDDLADRTGYSPTSRHVDNTLAVLRSRDLIAGGRQDLKASKDLFD